MNRSVALIVPFLLIPLSLGAKQTPAPRISIDVSPKPVIQGEPFKLEITVETEGEGEPNISLPRLGGFRILKQYESHPSSFHFSFGFGQGATNIRKEQAIYTFVLMADKPGKRNIDPVMVTLDGKRYKSNPYPIEIMSSQGGAPSGSAPQVVPGQPAGQPEPALPTDDQGKTVESLEGAKVDHNYFIQTAVSKKEAYVGEMLTMTIYIYMARHISNYDIIREPGTEGFWAENLIPSDRRHLSTEAVSINGRGYDRAAIRQLALFPIKPGAFTITPTVVELQSGMGGFFFSNRKTVKRSSLPVTVTVKDLPTENRPKEFNPANVGRYQFKASIDAKKVKVGEPITLTLTVSGKGNLRNIFLPEIEEIDGLKIYAPETEVEVQPQGLSITGVRKTKILMIPKKAGQYTLPALEWSYFDPEKEAYNTLTSKPIRIVVSENGEAAEETALSATASTKRVTKAGQDRLNRRLKSILSRSELRRPGDAHPVTSAWFLFLVIGVPLLYMGLFIASRTRRKLKEAQLKNRSKNADATALKNLQEIKKTEKSLSTEAFFAELQRTLLSFIENKIEDNRVHGDTMSELRERLMGRGFGEEHADMVVTETESCDFARFALGGSGNQERREAIERLESLVKILAKVKVTPRPKEKK
jgi:hypothetical protein